MARKISTGRAVEQWWNWGKPVVKIFVEGGGDKLLNTELRKAFKKFFAEAGFAGKLPTIRPSGGRDNTYHNFCIANKGKKQCMLLVDSEEAVNQQPDEPHTWNPWLHLQNRKGDTHWNKVGDNTDCHLMVQCMESWFCADKKSVAEYFGQGFHAKSLPANPNIEDIPKKDVLDGLKKAAENTAKKGYKKGRDSSELLERVNPQNVKEHSPWAKRFLTELKHRMGITV